MQDVIALVIVVVAAVLLTRPLWRRKRGGGPCDHCDCGSSDKGRSR